MRSLPKVLVVLAVLSFVLAVVTVYTGPMIHVKPEGFSRACSNLALIAIAMVLTSEDTRITKA
jgi:hypothetical protein